MIRRPPRSTLFPTRRSSDLRHDQVAPGRDALRDERIDVPGQERVRRGVGFPRRRRAAGRDRVGGRDKVVLDRKSTRLNSSHSQISYAVFCLKKKKKKIRQNN